ncbi:Di-sulfide bridge nucleocytoplasmic transport domain-containing protein [Chytriomyces cf. hyalinus JEL632]|nr:Di-sulfide bridge nucleocytoplasmic transport domain-containing protein [Chytriomyces cf. hyalinus JEL632]
MHRRDKYAPMDVDSDFNGWTEQRSTIPVDKEVSMSEAATTANTLLSKELKPKPKATEPAKPASKSARPSKARQELANLLEEPTVLDGKGRGASPNDSNSRFFKSTSNSNTPSNNTNSYQSNHLLLPYIIMGYLRLAFTLFTMALSVYFIVQFILTVKHDLDMKAVEYSSEIIQQVHDCSKLYLANRCSPPESRLPAMQQMCSEWELCMTRDPHEVGRLKVGAEAVAEVLNRLFEPLSIKTMVFGSILFFGTLYLYFTAPTFDNLKTLPPHLSHLQPGSHHTPAHQGFTSYPQHNHNASPYQGGHAINGSIMSNPAVGMPQFGVAAGAAQMHHHYYGVGASQASSVVDRGLRMAERGGYRRTAARADEVDEDDDE